MITIPSVELWGPSHARVDGGILAKGQDWSNGGNGTTTHDRDINLVYPHILSSLKYAARAIKKATGQSPFNPGNHGIIVSSYLASIMKSSAEFYCHKESIRIQADISPKGPWIGVDGTLYSFHIHITDEVAIPNSDFQWSKSAAILAHKSIIDGSIRSIDPGSAFYFTRCCR